MRKTTLLASFVLADDLSSALENISLVANIPESSIYIFELEMNPDEYLLTYNIGPELANLKFDMFWPNTISIHRKKETNTLFSLNALNQVIKQSNNGKLDSNFKVQWEKYENMLLLFKDRKLLIKKIKLLKK